MAPFPLFSFSPFLLCLLLLVPQARAHGPFDNSSHLIVSGDALELSVTMGMDGSRQFLLNAGLSEADITTALTVRGPGTRSSLSVDLAPKFFEATVDGKSLTARGVSVITDGLEASFTIAYSRPASGGLGLRALYFNGIEAMTPGSFIATDENRNVLGTTKLSRANPSAEIKLPASATAPVTAVEPAKPEPLSSATNTPVASTTALPTSVSFVTSIQIPAFVMIPALLLVVIAVWMALRRRGRSS